MYFENFPTIYHAYNGKDGQEILVTLKDITKNVRVRREVLANITLYNYYDLQDGETAEHVAEKVYGSAQYHWVIMIVNEKYDYSSDFPLPAVDLMNFITAKYGEGNEYKTHHFVNPAGFTVNENSVNATSISNFQYEDNINESKRRIKLIAPELLSTLLANFDSLMAV